MDPVTQFITEFKSGWRTSEFWAVVATSAWAVIEKAYQPGNSWASNLSTIGPLLVAGIYAAVRGYVKGKRLNNSADIIIATVDAAANSVLVNPAGDAASNVGPDGKPLIPAAA